MNDINPIAALLGSASMFAAVYLAALWIGPAWDAYAKRNIADILPRFRSLGLDEQQIGYWMRWWGVTLFATFLVVGVVMQMIPVAMGLMLIVFLAPRFLLDRMIERRQRQLRDQLVRASISVANGCRAGLGLAKSIEKTLTDTPQPLRGELARVVRDYKAGRPLPRALRDVQRRLNLESFTVFASAIIVALERGGDITFSLEKISHGLQEMQRLDRKLDADTASGRRLALILSLFPIAFLAMFSLLDPVAMSYMFNTLLGQITLVVVGAMVFGSAKWCMSILRIDF